MSVLRCVGPSAKRTLCRGGWNLSLTTQADFGFRRGWIFGFGWVRSRSEGRRGFTRDEGAKGIRRLPEENQGEREQNCPDRRSCQIERQGKTDEQQPEAGSCKRTPQRTMTVLATRRFRSTPVTRAEKSMARRTRPFHTSLAEIALHPTASVVSHRSMQSSKKSDRMAGVTWLT